MSSRTTTTTSTARPPQRDAWYAPVSIDMIVRVLNVTVLHPFACWMIPLCLRAQTFRWESPPMVGAVGWASFVTLCWVAMEVDRRIAHGLPREVDLSEEVIVITGGAGGLGMLIAEVYGLRGASVAVLDVSDMDNGEALGVTFYKCDVGDKAQVAKAALEIEKEVSSPVLHVQESKLWMLIRWTLQLGTPTVLINNAAVVIGKSLLDLSLEEIDRSLSTNLLGPFYCLKTFLPAIIRGGRGGTIVNISSVIGHLGAAQLTDYAAAKAGLSALHRSLSAELRATHPDIRTVLVTAGQLNTPLFRGVRTPNAFVAPVAEPVDVVKEVVAAVDGGLGAAVAVPLYARWVDWYGVLPAGVQLLARRVAGVDTGMRTFVGRQGRGSEKER